MSAITPFSEIGIFLASTLGTCGPEKSWDVATHINCWSIHVLEGQHNRTEPTFDVPKLSLCLLVFPLVLLDLLVERLDQKHIGILICHHLFRPRTHLAEGIHQCLALVTKGFHIRLGKCEIMRGIDTDFAHRGAAAL